MVDVNLLEEWPKAERNKEGDFPESERAAKETMAIPIYSELTAEQQTMVVETIMEFYGERRI